MNNRCLFCCKNEGNPLSKDNPIEKNEEGRVNEVLEKFLRFLERYIELPCDKCEKSGKLGGKPFWSELIKKGVKVCEKCLKVVKTFCVLYHDLESIKLLLNWQLWTLTNFINKDEGLSSVEEEFREEFLLKCSQKVRNSYPKLKIEKLPQPIFPIDREKRQGALLKLKNKSKPFQSTGNRINKSAVLIKELAHRRRHCNNEARLNFYKRSVRNSTQRIRSFRQKKRICTYSRPLSDIKIEPGGIEEPIDEEIQAENFPSPLPKVDLKTDQDYEMEEVAEEIKSFEDKEREVKEQCATLPRRHLRKVHKCSSCSKTFSTEKSLSIHVNDSECAKSAEDDFNDENLPEIDDDAYQPCDSPFDEDNQPEDFNEVPNRKKVQKKNMFGQRRKGNSPKQKPRVKCMFCNKSIVRKRLKPHIFEKHSKEWVTSKPSFFKKHLYHYRFKCPGESCKEIFHKVHSLLIHCKEKHESLQNKLQVEILSFIVSPESNYYKTLSSQVKKPTHYATVELSLPEDIRICQVESCKRACYSMEDFEAHKKLHGSFTCAFCPTTKDYLPELSVHELKTHRKGNSHSGSKAHFTCQRCSEPCNGFTRYMRHHALSHFSVKFPEFTCPVCKVYLDGDRSYNLFRHLKHCHNVSSKIIRCEEPSCHAYFSYKAYLTRHQSLQHPERTWTRNRRKKSSGAPSTSKVRKRVAEKGNSGDVGTKDFIPKRPRIVHKCSSCKKTFSTVDSLSLHKESCSPEEGVSEDNIGGDDPIDYVSGDGESEDECAKTRKNKSGTTENLKKRRSGKGHLQCKFCSKRFYKPAKLRRHVLSKHPEKWVENPFGKNSAVRYKCPGSLECEKLFKEMHLLLQHLREFHENQEDLEENSKSCISETLTIEIISFDVDPDSNYFKTLHSDVTNPKPYAKIEIPRLKPSESVLICPVESCKRGFYSKDELETHSKLHGKFTCAICSDTKNFLPEQSMHELRAHNGKKGSGVQIVKCQRCEAKFSQMHGYIRHHISEHFALKFEEKSCPVCKIYYINYEHPTGKKGRNRRTVTLFEHVKTCHGLDEIQTKRGHGLLRCTEPGCSAYFGDFKTLRDHWTGYHQMEKVKLKRLIAERDNRVCEECGKVFSSEERLARHRLAHKGPESWEFCCEVCSKKCLSENKLNEHMRVHTKEKPFICEVCGAKYAHRHNLRIHVNSKHGNGMQDNPQVKCKANSRKGIKRKKASSSDSDSD